MLTVTALGSFAVASGDATVTHFPTDKVRALLAYLVLEPVRPHRREQLAALLWSDSPQDRALKNLRLTLYRLRQTLDAATPGAADALLTVTHHTVAVNPAYLSVDALRLQQALEACDQHAHPAVADCMACLARLGTVAAEYRGSLLAGFSLSDAVAFDEWLLQQRESLHNLALLALHTLVTGYRAHGLHERALAYAQQALALDPYREENHRQLMALLACLGQPSRALAQYEQCVQILRHELDSSPTAETVALMEQIRSGTVAVYRPATASVLPTTVQPADQQPMPPQHLPTQLTPFVGREREVVEVVARLTQPDVRLLTLVGVGGMGKTRLALEAGRVLLDGFPDGVFFVDLAPLAVPTGIAAAIASALDLHPQDELQQAVLRYLRHKRLLLILDNLEQLLPAAAADPARVSSEAVDLIVALLQAAPQVQLLVTSRVRLQVRGEYVYSVEGLAYSQTASLAEAETLPAVQLLVQTMQRMQATFRLTTELLPAVLGICRLVEGMPLALELAAARAELVPLSTIQAEIAQSSAALVGNWHDLPPRQRSMRAVFAGSWKLLSANEQRVLRQLAIMRGGCSYAAAEAIAGASLQVIHQLVQASLLRHTFNSATGVGRYEMHELVRQFAAEQLGDNERATVAARHCAYYLAFVAQREQRLTGADPRVAAAEIRAEIDNLRQAWLWAVEHAHIDELEHCANGLYQFYAVVGLLAEREQLFALACQAVQAYAQQPAAAPHARRVLAKLLAFHATALARQRRAEHAMEVAQAAIALAQASQDSQALAYVALGWALHTKGHQLAAGEQLNQALRLIALHKHSQSASELVGVIEWAAHLWLGAINISLSNYEHARGNVLEALRICRARRQRLGEVDCLLYLGGIASIMHDLPAARSYYEQAWQLVSTVGSRSAEASMLLQLGDVLRLQGEYGRAIELAERALLVAREIGETEQVYLASAKLVCLYCKVGDTSRAGAWYAHFTEIDDSVVAPEQQVAALLAILVYVQQQGDYTRALALAEQCWDLARRFGPTDLQADSLVMLGRARAALHRSDAAMAYQQAIRRYASIGNTVLEAEVRAMLEAPMFEHAATEPDALLSSSA